MYANKQLVDSKIWSLNQSVAQIMMRDYKDYKITTDELSTIRPEMCN